jgi:prolipoprotein diacylglyceryltransferase
MLPILQIGPLALQTPGLILLIGVWVALTIAERQAHYWGAQAGDLNNLALVGLVSGVLGARLVYVGRYPGAFSASPGSLISLNPGLLDPSGGLAVGVLAALVYGQRKSLPFWSTLDALTPALAGFLIAFHLSHLASGAAFGSPSDLPWAINLWGAERHPAQVYEALAAIAVAYLVWPRARRPTPGPQGRIFLTFIALSAGSRLFLEAFRGDSPLLSNGWRIPQLAAWAVLALSLFGLMARDRHSPTAGK